MDPKSLEEQVRDLRARRLETYKIDKLAEIEDRKSTIKKEYEEKLKELEGLQNKILLQEFIPNEEGAQSYYFNLK